MRLAAIDLGSNSFRLEIAKVENDAILSEGSWKETVRLAAGLDANRNLSIEAQERALTALSRIAEKIKGFPRAQIRAVGTQTFRAAHNSAEFLTKAEEVLGCPIEILSGKEEARLVFEGCSFALPASDKTRLIVDIGGGSTECVVGRKREVLEAESFHVGCVNTSVRFFENGEVNSLSMYKAQVAAEAQMEGDLRKLINVGWDEVFGSSGTAGAVSEIMRQSGWSDGKITLQLLLRLRDEIIKCGNTSKFRFEGMKDDRREVLAGGVAVLLAVFNKLHLKEMRPAGGALRFGILYDLAGRKLDQDPRESAVRSLIERLNTDKEQAERVAMLSVDLFKELNPEAMTEDLRVLKWAALLHEIGLSVARSDYHKHSDYLIRNSEIPGFSKSEQERLASIVLGHRGNLKKVADYLEGQKTAEMILCLRLAVILEHARYDVKLPLIKLFARSKTFTVSLPKSFLDEHPLTEYLLSQEEDIWAKVGYKLDIYVR